MACEQPGLGAIIGKAAEGSDGGGGMIWTRVHLQSGSNLHGVVATLAQENSRARRRIAEIPQELESVKARLDRLESVLHRLRRERQAAAAVRSDR